MSTHDVDKWLTKFSLDFWERYAILEHRLGSLTIFELFSFLTKPAMCLVGLIKKENSLDSNTKIRPDKKFKNKSKRIHHHDNHQ
jgi:hypothetical protein